jgi:hypothetical protein
MLVPHVAPGIHLKARNTVSIASRKVGAMIETPTETDNEILTEPVLPMSDIQGMVVPGFLKPHQMLIGVTFGSDSESSLPFQTILAYVYP